MKYIVIILLFVTYSASTQTFKNLPVSVEAKAGFLFLDVKEYPRSNGHFKGDGVLLNLNLLTEFELWRGNVYTGVGYSNFKYWNIGLNFGPIHSPSNSNYFDINLGYELFLGKRFLINTNIASHILLDKIGFLSSIKRFYQNIEVGVGYEFLENFKLKVCSPITTFPMFQNDDVAIGGIPPSVPILKPWVEQVGVIVSLTYRIK